jgi:hypothetical protein
MIIINQNKTMFLNFENIEAVGINNPLENNEGKFAILVETTSDHQYTIAIYKTEERANEVLNEILEEYSRWKYDKNMSVIITPKAYRMPLE